MEPARQRSRKGCLTCRQRRKKCDEIKPVCGRCKGGDDCIWPASRSASRGAPRSSRLPRIQPRPSLVPKSTTMFVPTETTPMSVSRDDEPNTSSSSSPELDAEYSNIFPETTIGNNSRHLVSYPFVDFGLNTVAPLPELSTSSTPTPSSFGFHRLGWGHKSPPPTSSSLALICIDDEPDHALDEDEEDAFKTTEWLPGTLQLVHLYLSLELPNQNQVQWSSVIESYFTFFIRNSYDPSNFPTHISDLVARHFQLESVRLAVLSTSLLFYSFLNPGLPQIPLRKHAMELIDAAATALWLEELQPDTTPSAQLAGISEIFGFYYYIGDLGSYMRYIEQALPVVQKLVGTAPVSIHKLYGSETLDIRLFAWCDVFSAMATSRPARLVYDCNVAALLQRNQTGPDTQYLDSGLEWMAGLPDAFLLLTIQILNLKHTPMSSNERVTQAATIEATLREWKVWPSGIANSVMRVQRVSAQEIWRHSTILYLYQVVHKATPRQEVVQQSVKQIIKLASTLRPGHNPDCLLYIPYFLAGTFAASAKDRRFIRDRLMRCSVDPYMNTLVNALDELWRGTFIDKHNDWTSRSPPLIIF